MINTDREIVLDGGSYHVRKEFIRYRVQKDVFPSEFAGRTTFQIYEFTVDGVPLSTYDNSEHRPSLTVEVYHPREKFGELAPAGISWPSTSDDRPALAWALSETLRLAFRESGRLNEEAGF